MKEQVGWARGPGETEDIFHFVTDKIMKLKVGEFVYYEVQDNMKILCRIDKREELGIDSLGYKKLENKMSEEQRKKGKEGNLYNVKCKILGVYDDNYGGFRNLRFPPDIGDPVYYTKSKVLSDILRSNKQRGILKIGKLLSRNENEVKVFVDMDAIATKHLSVLASTGAGKSYTVGVLLEEMVKKGNRGASFVFDIHNEYQTMGQDPKYGERFNVIKSPKIKLSNLNTMDFDVAFEEKMTKIQKEKLEEVLESLDVSTSKSFGSEIKSSYFIEDIIDELDQGNEIDDNITWRLRSIEDFVCLSKDEQTNVCDIFQPGRCNIIQFPKGADNKERNLIAWYFMTRIFQSRQRVVKGMERDQQSEITTPVTLVIEEAHNFAPVNKEVRTRDLLQEIAREGRKFGLGICVVTQRPSRMDEDVLSQCNSSIIMKMKNHVDQETVERSVEAAGEDLIKDLPGLTTGQAVVAGDFISTPVITKIRERETEHGGDTPDVAEKSIKEYKNIN